MSVRTDRDAAARRLQARQHGLITREQAFELGYSSSAIARKVNAGAWVRVHPGIYRDAAVPADPLSNVLAACLACGPGAVAAGVTAGFVWTLDAEPPAIPHVLVPGRRPAVDGVRIQRVGVLDRLDTTTHRGVPVTAPMATLVWMAADVDSVLLETALDVFWSRGSLHPDRLAEYLAQPRHRTRPGTVVLRALVSDRANEPGASPLESTYFSILRRFRVPLPQRGVSVVVDKRRYLDCSYEAEKVVVELDSFAHHAVTRERFVDERTRQMMIERLGWQFLRFTKPHLLHQPLWVAMMTADAIGLAPARWRKT